MKIIIATAITAAMLTYSSVAETDYAAWASGGTYAVDDRRIYNHVIYECTDAHTGRATTPDLDTDYWLAVGATNRWRMFDAKIGTVTSDGTPMSWKLRPAGPIGGLHLAELIGTSLTVVVKDSPGGTTVFNSGTIDLDGTIVLDVYDWFFADQEQRSEVTLTNLPEHYFDPEITITLTAASGTVACGACVIGRIHTLGDLQYEANVGIADFSKKTRDSFGNLTLEEGEWSKRATMAVETAPGTFNRAYRRLASLRAQLAVYVGTELYGLEPLVVYGFYKDFSLVVKKTKYDLCSLEVEGLTT